MSLPWLRPLWQQLTTDLHSGRLSHAHCFPWQPELGLDRFIYTWIEMLLCLQPSQRACGNCKSCLLGKAKTHPDFYELSSEDGKAIGIDAVRSLTMSLQQTANQAGRKVAWIRDAELLTVAAANALLKTLEEPTAETILIVSASRPRLLLPTLLSRMQKHTVSSPPLIEVEAWLQQQLGRALTADEQPWLQRLAHAPLTLLAKLRGEVESHSAAAFEAEAHAAVEQLIQAFCEVGTWPTVDKNKVRLWLTASEYFIQELVRIYLQLPHVQLHHPDHQSELQRQLQMRHVNQQQLNDWLQTCYAIRRWTTEQSGLNGVLLLQDLWAEWQIG
ncbi:hypothetical protein [Pseudidiomarina aestuarii]|uniref:hypothetical protein n=1 Tax=Pseudidiomarina aestuarii TaxID=624146 RepID=UPI001472C117|nr:hypothetical protein [Pseudidiomarina aestuarii]